AVEVAGEPVAAGGEAPNLQFDPDAHRVSGSTGCNRIGGTYALDANTLRFGALATTRMACADAAMTLESRFSKALEVVRRWRIDGSHLNLLDEYDGVVVRLTTENGEHQP